MRIRTPVRVVALGAVLLIAAACSNNNGGGTATSAPPSGGTKGGTAVFGAEQWPQCLNIITSCATSTWMQIVGPQPTLPKLAMLDSKSNYVASPLVTELPSTDNGGLVESPFTITWHLNPKAVWDDGTPITSADIAFTNAAILNTTGTTGPVGYDQITSIDTTDPQTAVLHFKAPYADWLDLFGGGGTNGYVLKKAAFPDADAAKPDLSKDMNNLIPFSGGPWKMQSWSKSQEILVRNDKYWGHQSLLDQVTFIPLEDQPTEIASLLSGQVDAIFPQAGAASILDQLKTNPNAKSVAGPTNYGDAFWYNLEAAPISDLKVRQAFAYGVDRQAIIDQIIKVNDPNAEVLQCLPPLYPVIGTWCNDAVQAPYKQYTYDPAKSISLLESDGYDCSAVPNGPCTKDGKPLKIISYYTAGNTRRQAVGALVQEKIKPAGFQFVPTPHDPTDLFSNVLVKGTFVMMEFANGGGVDPSPTSYSWLCDQIPTKANGYAGANDQRYCNTTLDPTMVKMDQTVDPTQRHTLSDQVYTQIFTDMPALPLYPFINITAWLGNKIAGPVGEWNTASYGTYYNMDYWYVSS